MVIGETLRSGTVKYDRLFILLTRDLSCVESVLLFCLPALEPPWLLIIVSNTVITHFQVTVLLHLLFPLKLYMIKCEKDFYSNDFFFYRDMVIMSTNMILNDK